MKQYRVFALVVTVVVLAVVAAHMKWRVCELEKQIAANKSVPADLPNKVTQKKPASHPLNSQKTVATTSPAVVQQNKASQVAQQPNVVPTMSPLSSDMSNLLSDARAAMGRKAYDKAREFLESAYLGTLDPDGQMRIGQMLYECLIKTHAYEEAKILGFQLLALTPTPKERLVLTQQLAALLYKMGRSDEVESLLKDTLAKEQDPEVRMKYDAQLRNVWRHTPGRMSEVVSNLVERLVMEPRDESALRQLGDIYLKSRRDHKSAQPVYERLASLHPEDAQVQATLLGIYRENGNFDGMRRLYEEQLAGKGGNDTTLRFQIAQTEIMAGRGDEAIKYVEKYLSGEKASSFDLQMLATTYEKVGRINDALVIMDKAMTKESDKQKRINMQFQKVDILLADKRYAEVETLLRSIIAVSDDNKQTIGRAKSQLIHVFEMQGRTGDIQL